MQNPWRVNTHRVSGARGRYFQMLVMHWSASSDWVPSQGPGACRHRLPHLPWAQMPSAETGRMNAHSDALWLSTSLPWRHRSAANQGGHCGEPHPPSMEVVLLPHSQLALPIFPVRGTGVSHFLPGHFLHTLRNVFSDSLCNLPSPWSLNMTDRYHC